MQVNNYTMRSARNSKIFLLLFFLCCSLPLLLAKLAVEFSWFAAGVASRGQWLEHEIQLLPITQGLSDVKNARKPWHLVYVQASSCDAECEMALYTLQQLYFGFSGQQEKIDLAILADQAPQQLSYFPAIKWQPAKDSLNALQNQIFIVDRQGTAILRYAAANDRGHMLKIGKDIRADLRRLLVYDRGGL